MATFYANPNDEDEPWIEKAALDGLPFRVWHAFFFCFCFFVLAVVLVCCCVKIRVPRTKQEIEADHQRKQLTAKFKGKLKLIDNQDMDGIDLERGKRNSGALEIIRNDLDSGCKKAEPQIKASDT